MRLPILEKEETVTLVDGTYGKTRGRNRANVQVSDIDAGETIRPRDTHGEVVLILGRSWGIIHHPDLDWKSFSITRIRPDGTKVIIEPKWKRSTAPSIKTIYFENASVTTEGRVRTLFARMVHEEKDKGEANMASARMVTVSK